ncbi:hypothetical protein ILUMI_18255 [Ignelater luminosus]|uniref:Uncharacterized protein n=1 Tax=Ignelater luminosus TaxID=2038154 RepID=A0A8K0CIC4_IGNLU|nr:hypothetical protein ILUMI_18255 [Ignelater luminosus]
MDSIATGMFFNLMGSFERAKTRDVALLLSEVDHQKLAYATQKSLLKSGKRTAAEVVQLATNSSPRSLKKVKMAPKMSSAITPYTPKEALALIINSGLGKVNYLNIQSGTKKREANIYPPYNIIAQAKQQCYPDNISVTESEAQIPLQDLLDHTVKRLVQVQSEVLEQRIPDNVDIINILYKWSLDGSGGHSIYKQNFSNNAKYGDSNILCTIVPLKMSIMQKKR